MPAFAAFVTPLLTAALACASALPRQTQVWESPFSGTITAPTSNVVLISGANFSFAYARSNWCESDFSPFTVYVAQGAAPPAFSGFDGAPGFPQGVITAEQYAYPPGPEGTSRTPERASYDGGGARFAHAHPLPQLSFPSDYAADEHARALAHAFDQRPSLRPGDNQRAVYAGAAAKRLEGPHRAPARTR